MGATSFTRKFLKLVTGIGLAARFGDVITFCIPSLVIRLIMVEFADHKRRV